MRDHLPGECRKRLALADRIRGIYAKYGYAPIETPAMEKVEILRGNDPENEKLMYEVMKRGEKLEEARRDGTPLTDLALRFDLTIPLARFYATHRAKLPPVFRCQHIGPVWRADRPQKGRFREFMQCDVDAVGSSSPALEAEVILATAEVFRTLLGDGFAVHLNDRRLLAKVLDELGVPPDRHADALIAIDKLDKIGEDGVLKELTERGVSADLLPRLKAAPETADLNRVRSLVAAAPGSPRLVFDPFLVRGQGYYTGPIFEVRMPGFPGAMAGGGRYDGLIGRFLDKPVPAVGFSIGFERLLLVLEGKGIALEGPGEPQVFIPMTETGQQEKVFALAAVLRARGLRVLTSSDPGKLPAQLKLADETLRIPFAAILDADGRVVLKDLKARASDPPRTSDEAAAELLHRLKPA
jgi:histidyl-tRNA synthetase